MWSVLQTKKIISYIPIPLQWSYIIYYRDGCYQTLLIYTKTYYFILLLNNLRLAPSQYGVQVNLTSKQLWIFNQWYLYALTSFIFTKIKFKGKTYRIYIDRRNTLIFQLGYSHKIYFYATTIYAWKLAKFLFFFVSFNFLKLFRMVSSIRKIKPINIYTSRGLRFTNDCIYKKLGKVNL